MCPDKKTLIIYSVNPICVQKGHGSNGKEMKEKLSVVAANQQPKKIHFYPSKEKLVDLFTLCSLWFLSLHRLFFDM